MDSSHSLLSAHLSAKLSAQLRAIARRDPKFDGRFYYGVVTTGVYCRPVCVARPKLKNVRIFRSRSEAERLGYRPCLRCQPDVAPGTKAFARLQDRTATTVTRGLALISERTREKMSVPRLASSLGMTDRHLRRLFDLHVGASPIEVINSNRLYWAKRLLVGSDLAMSDVAFASGFQSVRRFNAAFQKLYKMSPRRMRAASGPVDSIESAAQFSIGVRLPYDWSYVLQYLKRHEACGLESVSDDGSYTRNYRGGRAEVRFLSDRACLDVQVFGVDAKDWFHLLNGLRRLFDVDHNPSELPRAARGVRVPGAFDPFETAVSIVLSQLVSTAQAKRNLCELIRGSGDGSGDGTRFPSPRQLSEKGVREFGVRTTAAKESAIQELACLVQEGEIELSPSADFEATKERLLKIRGIGPWTVEMIAMRCLGDADAFPKNDLVVKRALESVTSTRKVGGRVGEWSLARAYWTHFLWRAAGSTK